MYNIAICDDEKSICAQLEEFINKFLSEHYIKGNIDVFFSGESLCDYLKREKKIDLIFLDIELPKMNGMEVGKYLREVLKNELTDIIYISSKTSYALELFKSRPLDFIIKPLKYSVLENILNIVLKRNSVRQQSFSWQFDKISYKIALQEILYFKSDNKKVHMLLTSGEEHVFMGKLDSIEKSLPESSFLKIHNSYLINYDYVSQYSSEWVRMVNGDILNISKSHRTDVKSKLMHREMQ